MGQKIDIVYYDSFTNGDTTGGVYGNGYELNSFPLDVRIKSATLILEAETAFTKAMNSTVTVAPDEGANKFVREDMLIYQITEMIETNDTGFMYMVPDNVVTFFNLMWGSNTDEWLIDTQDTDIVIKLSQDPLHIYQHHHSYDGAVQSAGSADVFLILECEVL
jgi:hypothetical protein